MALATLVLITNCNKRSVANEEIIVNETLENTATEEEEEEKTEEAVVNTTATVNLATLVAENTNLTQLNAAIQTANLVATLSTSGSRTFFAPTDEAAADLFYLLGEGYNSFADFDTEVEKGILQRILLYHTIEKQILAADLKVTTLDTAVIGETLEVITNEQGFGLIDGAAEEANLTTTDLLATNGVIHLIDKILISKEIQDFINTLEL